MANLSEIFEKNDLLVLNCRIFFCLKSFSVSIYLYFVVVSGNLLQSLFSGDDSDLDSAMGSSGLEVTTEELDWPNKKSNLVDMSPSFLPFFLYSHVPLSI